VHGKQRRADGPTWISLHRVQTWAFQRVTENLKKKGFTRFVVRRKSNCSRMEAECDREAPKLSVVSARGYLRCMERNNRG